MHPKVSQSVKDVLQSLVDDGIVQADKIGSSNCMLRICASFTHIPIDTCSFLELSVSTWSPRKSFLKYALN